jgi:hypothetical protein
MECLKVEDVVLLTALRNRISVEGLQPLQQLRPRRVCHNVDESSWEGELSFDVRGEVLPRVRSVPGPTAARKKRSGASFTCSKVSSRESCNLQPKALSRVFFCGIGHFPFHPFFRYFWCIVWDLPHAFASCASDIGIASLFAVFL